MRRRRKGAHLVCQDAVLSSRPEVSEPVETRNLEVLERSSLLDVLWHLGHLDERRSAGFRVAGALGREEGAARAFEVGFDGVGGDGTDCVVVLPGGVGVDESSPLAEVFDCEGGRGVSSVEQEGAEAKPKLTMVMVDIMVSRSVALGDDPLHNLVAIELLRQPLLVNLERLEVFSRSRRVV